MGVTVSRICTVAVRGGSKGVPGKNWRVIAGQPLFAHSIIAARKSGLFDAIVVSSDAPEVLDNALEVGATHVVIRPAELASDTSGKVPAIVHAVQSVENELGITFDVVTDLDATSPLRDISDIHGAVQLLESQGIESVVTAAEARRSPYFNLIERNSKTGQVGVSKKLPQGVLRRQDAPETFDMNASIYVWDRDVLMESPQVFYPTTQIFQMPPERSLDIDSEFDFEIVRWLMEKS
jgi:N-acylneuraminate cytidylyltransferase/CMP-N,N'-diacetyllegionaminic acid synthase